MHQLEKPKRKRIRRSKLVYRTSFSEKDLVDKKLNCIFVQQTKLNETRT